MINANKRAVSDFPLQMNILVKKCPGWYNEFAGVPGKGASNPYFRTGSMTPEYYAPAKEM